MLGGVWGICEFLGVLTNADPPEMLPDAAHKKILMGIGGFVLGFIFLALGLSFYLHKKVRGGPGGRVPPPLECVCSPWGPPAWCHSLFSAYRAPEPAVATDPSHGLRPSWDPPFHPRADFGGVMCPQSPAVTLSPPGCSQCSQ